LNEAEIVLALSGTWASPITRTSSPKELLILLQQDAQIMSMVQGATVLPARETGFKKEVVPLADTGVGDMLSDLSVPLVIYFS
jgi:hypothetical protein